MKAMLGPIQKKGVIKDLLLASVPPETKSILDIGAGVKPFDHVSVSNHVCVEPHPEYVKVLQEKGFTVIEKTALEMLPTCPPFDVVMLLDVIEHMDKDVGEEVVELAKKVATKAVIIFTPIGFMRQEFAEGKPDPWGYNGHYWQKHRSGWMPEDFPDWEIAIDMRFHRSTRNGAFIAVWHSENHTRGVRK